MASAKKELEGEENPIDFVAFVVVVKNTVLCCFGGVGFVIPRGCLVLPFLAFLMLSLLTATTRGRLLVAEHACWLFFIVRPPAPRTD